MLAPTVPSTHVASRIGWVQDHRPGSPDLAQEEVPQNLIIKTVVDRPEDTEMLILYDQLQDRPETFSHVKILCPAPLLPGVDGEQLQCILRGQRPLLLQFFFTPFLPVLQQAD